MTVRYHVNLTYDALKRWFIAQCYDSLAVGALWLIALLIIHVPFAPLWAVLAVFLQFIPQFGTIISLIGPVLSLALTAAGWDSLLYLGIAYAAIVVIDGLILQPYLMRRQNRVPIWASIFVPIALGFVIPFWGVLLGPPLLAVIYAYKGRTQEPTVRSGDGIILPPEHRR